MGKVTHYPSALCAHVLDLQGHVWGTRSAVVASVHRHQKLFLFWAVGSRGLQDKSTVAQLQLGERSQKM